MNVPRRSSHDEQSTMNKAYSVRLTGRAARFIQLLQDYGHLDEGSIDQIVVALAETAGSSRESTVDLPQVKRVAAMTLFSHHGESLDEAHSVLAQDWPLLFS